MYRVNYLFVGCIAQEEEEVEAGEDDEQFQDLDEL